MNNSKFRKFAVVLAAVLSVGLASCGDSESSKDTKESKASEETSSAAAAESKGGEQVESKTEGGDVTTPAADSSAAEELVTAATKPASEIVAEIPVTEAKSAKLKEAGKLKAEGIGFYDDFLYKEKSEDEVEILNYLGKTLCDGKAEYVEKLGKTGLYTYQIDGGDILYSGIIDAQGNKILDETDKVGTFGEIDERYVKAYIPDKVTTNKDEAIYYATNRRWSVDVKDEDILYTGTVKVYDTVNKKFLESTAQTYDPRYEVHGDIITFYDADKNLVNVNAETDTKLDLGNKQAVGSTLLAEYKDSKYYCYDHDQNLLFVTPYTLGEFNDSCGFLSIYDSNSGMRGIIHESGTVMVEPKYKSVDHIAGEYFAFYNEDFSKRGLLKADGTEVTPCQYKTITDVGVPGYFNVSGEDGKYSLIDATGKEVVGGEDYGFSEGSYVKSGDTYKYFVVSKGDMSLELNTSGSYLGNFLLYDSKTKTLYDLVTGEKVIKDVDKISSAYGYVYAIKGKDITVYEIEKQ